MSTNRITTALTRQLLSLMAIVCLALPMTASAEVHPYGPWAEELGIDLNVSYDGTRVMVIQGNTFEVTERRAPGKMYTEVDMGGVKSGVILREDLNKSYVLMPSMGFYQENSLDDGVMQAGNGMEFDDIQKVGRETINGHASTKYKTRFEDNEGKGTGHIWVSDTGVPMKIDMLYSNRSMKNERIVMHLKELNLRAQDASYFELPANLRPMNMSSLGEMFKMAGAAQPAPAAKPAAAPAPAATTAAAPAQTAEQECLQAAAAKAQAKREKAQSGGGFGRLLGAVSRTAARFGLEDVTEATRDAQDISATADDANVIAEELGITQDDITRCQQQ